MTSACAAKCIQHNDHGTHSGARCTRRSRWGSFDRRYTLGYTDPKTVLRTGGVMTELPETAVESGRPDPYAEESREVPHEVVPMPTDGWRVLGFGAHDHVARGVQDRLRQAGLRATALAVTDDAKGDSHLAEALAADSYDAVAIGAFLSGQDPSTPATAESTAWFNRVLNLVHAGAPRARIVLVRGPQNAVDDINRVLADS
jgi:hypothetical protein